ncbi:MAG: 50S ribosomal protein L11 methyltransferase [Bacteroidota bacterium]
MEQHICLTIEIDSPEQSDSLIAFLAENGFDGFEEMPDRLLAYRPDNEWVQQSDVLTYLSENNVAYDFSTIEKTNWNQVWESNFTPVRVNDLVGIRAAFHAPMNDVTHELVITPKMSFGTGHHITTRLMVQMMNGLIRPGDRVLDFGTGTGVLAILAKKMGAGEVIGIDIEDWSIENAIDNAKENGTTDIEFRCADRIDVTGAFETILANINRNILLDHMTDLKKVLSPGGTLLLSGVLEEDLTVMDQALSQVGLHRINIAAEKGWICMQSSDNQ